jgi:hypothetical protein
MAAESESNSKGREAGGEISRPFRKEEVVEENKIVERDLPCVLTNDEIIEKSKALAKAHEDCEALEKRLKDVSSDIKGKIATEEASIGILSRAISNGYEYRMVECVWEFDYKKEKKRLIRTDTGELVKEETIPFSERQEKLPGQ